MNIRPDKSNTLAWFLVAASFAGFIAGKPVFRSYSDNKASAPELYERGKSVVILDYTPETWDEMSPVSVFIIEKLIEKKNDVCVLSTDLSLSFWFEHIAGEFKEEDEDGLPGGEIKWSGFLPGIQSSAAELFRDPVVVTGDSLFGPAKTKYIIISSGENFHYWIFFGWARHRPDAVYFTSSSFFPWAELYSSSGQVVYLGQGISSLEKEKFLKRRASVAWFAILFGALIFIKTIRVYSRSLKGYIKTGK
ncbi:hypothetical protein JW890_01165 [candidate division WOR-3 bacterium]|nr:hypothetical protein [candidate division WOR-3 bacterium]